MVYDYNKYHPLTRKNLETQALITLSPWQRPEVGEGDPVRKTTFLKDFPDFPGGRKNSAANDNPVASFA